MAVAGGVSRILHTGASASLGAAHAAGGQAQAALHTAMTSTTESCLLPQRLATVDHTAFNKACQKALGGWVGGFAWAGGCGRLIGCSIAHLPVPARPPARLSGCSRRKVDGKGVGGVSGVGGWQRQEGRRRRCRRPGAAPQEAQSQGVADRGHVQVRCCCAVPATPWCCGVLWCCAWGSHRCSALRWRRRRRPRAAGTGGTARATSSTCCSTWRWCWTTGVCAAWVWGVGVGGLSVRGVIGWRRRRETSPWLAGR